VIPFDYSNVAEENRGWVGQYVKELPSAIAKIPDIQVKKAPDSADPADFINQNTNSGNYVLHGNVVQANDQLRLSLELIDTNADSILFADKFELGSEAVFSIQDEITSQVIAALSVYLNDNERTMMLEWGTKNASAYKQFLKPNSMPSNSIALILITRSDIMRKLSKKMLIFSMLILAWQTRHHEKPCLATAERLLNCLRK